MNKERNYKKSEKEKEIKNFSSIEILTELGKRLKNREIVGVYTNYTSLHVRKYPKLAINSESDNKVIFQLDLDTGEKN